MLMQLPGITGANTNLRARLAQIGMLFVRPSIRTLEPDALSNLIGQLGDMRPLPAQTVTIHTSVSVEGSSHSGAKVVHAAVALVLNETTSKDFEVVHNGADLAVRAWNMRQL